MEIMMEAAYLGMPLGSTPREWKQDWAEGEDDLQYSLNKGLRQLYRWF